MHETPAIPAEKVTGPALLTGFSGESLRKPLSESLAASGLAGFAGMANETLSVAPLVLGVVTAAVLRPLNFSTSKKA
jgi:hypothetical protein